MGVEVNKNKLSSLLLERFNNREMSAFSEFYTLYYNEFYHLANKFFYQTDLHPDDVVQDIFINIWDNKKKKFDTLEGLKLFIYVCIKNRLRNYVDHEKHRINHRNFAIYFDDFYVHIAETEVLSAISQAINLLPTECARVFKLHVDGWNIHDIAEKLNKSESTVYKQRQEAISILKRRIGRSKLLTILLFFLII